MDNEELPLRFLLFCHHSSDYRQPKSSDGDHLWSADRLFINDQQIKKYFSIDTVDTVSSQKENLKSDIYPVCRWEKYPI